MIGRVAWAFFWRGAQAAASYRTGVFFRLAGGGAALAALYFLARFVNAGRNPLLSSYGGDYFAFVLLGTALLNLQNTVVSAYPMQIRFAQLEGTLEALLATPTPSWIVLLCAPVYRVVDAIVGAALYLAAGGLLFGISFASLDLLSLGVVVPLMLVAFCAVGFLGAALTMVLRRSEPFTLMLGGLSALVGGVLYPTAVLPSWLARAGHVLPLTHALELVRRAVLEGASLQALWPSLWSLILFCAVAAPVGLLSFAWTVRRARRDGSLSHF